MPEGEFADKLILLVDDEVFVRRALVRVARQKAFRVCEADDGVQAIQLARDLDPAVILLDLSLPDISGLDVLRRLRKDPRTARTLVVIMSGHDMEQRRGEVFALGANGYVTKPFNASRLFDDIDNMIAQAPQHFGADASSGVVEAARNLGVINVVDQNYKSGTRSS